jgi:hypothetical protein
MSSGHISLLGSTAHFNVDFDYPDMTSFCSTSEKLSILFDYYVTFQAASEVFYEFEFLAALLNSIFGSIDQWVVRYLSRYFCCIYI